jgi:hypothetical protein
MASQDSMDRGPRGCTNAANDLRDQAAVLTHVLALHPAHLTTNELARELVAVPTDFESQDRFERAVRDLAAVGLLHVCGELILPTRAALVFDSLERC